MSSLWSLPVLCVLALLAAGDAGSAVAQTIDPRQLYEQRCGGCHAQHAGDFVHDSLFREELLLKDGVLVERYSKRNIERFLTGHGRLTAEEVPRIIDALIRQLSKE